MAKKILFSDLMDIPSTKEYLELLKMVESQCKAIISLGAKVTSTGIPSDAAGLKEYTAAIKNATAAKQESEKIDEKIKQVNEDLIRQNVQNAKARADLKDKINSETSAYKALEVEYKKSLQNSKDLAAQYGIQSKQAKESAAQTVALNNKLKEIDSTLGNHQRNVGNYKSALMGIKDSLLQVGSALGIGFGVTQLIQFGKESYKLYETQLKQERLLLNALGGRKDQEEILKKQAEEMAGRFAIDQNEILSVQKMAVARGLSIKQTKELTEASFQLSAVTGVDVNTSAKQLIGTYSGVLKGINKWVDGTKELSKEQMANGAVVDLVNKKYAGFAEAAVTDSQKAAHSWEEFQKGFGKSLAEVVSSVSEFGSGTGIETNKWGEALGDYLLKWNTLSVMVKSVTGSIEWAVNGISDLFTDFSGTMSNISDAVGGFFTHMYDKIEQLFNDPKEWLIDLKSSFMDFIGFGEEAESTVNKVNEAFKAVVNNTEDAASKVKDLYDTLKDLVLRHVITEKRAKEYIALFERKVAEARKLNAKKDADDLDDITKGSAAKQADLEQMKIDAMDDGYAKEKAIEQKRHEDWIKSHKDDVNFNEAEVIEEQIHTAKILKINEDFATKWKEHLDKIAEMKRKAREEELKAEAQDSIDAGTEQKGILDAQDKYDEQEKIFALKKDKDFENNKLDIQLQAIDEKLANTEEGSAEYIDLQTQEAAIIHQIKENAANEEREESLKQREAALQAIEEYAKAAQEKRQRMFDSEIDQSKRHQDLLKDMAARGNQDAKNNLAMEEANQAKLEMKKEKALQHAKQMEAGLAILKTYSAALGKEGATPESAMKDTIKSEVLLAALIKAMPTFLLGTEDTGEGGNLDGKGGKLAKIHPHERILTAEQNKMVDGLSNWQLVNAGLMHKKELETMDSDRFMSNEKIYAKFDELKAEIKNKPVYLGNEYHKDSHQLCEMIEQGNSLVRNHKTLSKLG